MVLNEEVWDVSKNERVLILDHIAFYLLAYWLIDWLIYMFEYVVWLGMDLFYGNYQNKSSEGSKWRSCTMFVVNCLLQ